MLKTGDRRCNGKHEHFARYKKKNTENIINPFPKTDDKRLLSSALGKLEDNSHLSQRLAASQKLCRDVVRIFDRC